MVRELEVEGELAHEATAGSTAAFAAKSGALEVQLRSCACLLNVLCSEAQAAAFVASSCCSSQLNVAGSSVYVAQCV
jgi:hypothetical protein